MEVYQLLGVAVMVAMGFVVHSTVRLNKLRKEAQVPKRMLNTRDWSVLTRPSRFSEEEVSLVRKNWLACGALFALVMLLIASAPEDVMERFRLGPVVPVSSDS